jgi:hypothetical protein
MTPFVQDVEEVQNYPAIVSITRYPNHLGMSITMVRHLEGCAKISAFGARHVRCRKVAIDMKGNEKLLNSTRLADPQKT